MREERGSKNVLAACHGVTNLIKVTLNITMI